MKNGYMSGSELRQYLHISTRKMKYLMDHNLIPHENTGNPTHRYRIKEKDAKEFKWRMEHEPLFMAEHAGNFSSKKNPAKRRQVKKSQEEMPEKIKAPSGKSFKAYLEREWKNLPDALLLTEASNLIGYPTKNLRDAMQSGNLVGIKVQTLLYIPKGSFISYLSSAEILQNASSVKFKNLIVGCKK